MEAVRLDPRWRQAWVRLGVLAGVNGGLDAAERCFRSACDADPKCVDAWFNLRIVLEKSDRRRSRKPLPRPWRSILTSSGPRDWSD